jgi:hypothetical protein
MKLENRGQEHVSLWSPVESFKVLVSIIGWSGNRAPYHFGDDIISYSWGISRGQSNFFVH